MWGLRFGNPLFAVALHVVSGCVCVSVSIGDACVCMLFFGPTTSRRSGCKPRGLFINTGIVYKHVVLSQRVRARLTSGDYTTLSYVTVLYFCKL